MTFSNDIFKFAVTKTIYILVLISAFDEHETGPVENLGQVVFGEQIRSSPYKVQELFYFFLEVFNQIQINKFPTAFLKSIS